MKSLQVELIGKGLSDASTGEVEEKCISAKGKTPEQISDREWTELMRTNRQTYKWKMEGWGVGWFVVLTTPMFPLHTNDH